MWENYHECKERQNWALAQRMCQQKVRNCLKSLIECVHCHDERALGIELYLQICSNYSDIFLSTTCDHFTKLVLASKVTFFFKKRCLGSMWIQLLKLHSLANNVVWTYICLCHFIALLVVLFKNQYPHLPISLHLMRSNSCDSFLSMVDGMVGMECAYNFHKIV